MKILAVLIADYKQVDESLMEKWVKDFYSWDICDGTIQNVHLKFGLYVDITDKNTGLVLRRFLPEDYSQKYQRGDNVKVQVVDVKSNGNIDLKLVN